MVITSEAVAAAAKAIEGRGPQERWQPEDRSPRPSSDAASAAGKAIEGSIGPGLIGHELAAQYLDVPVSTLHRWNSRGEGPASCRMGKHRKYRVSDLDAFIEAKMRKAG